jgi:hypothetical protein
MPTTNEEKTADERTKENGGEGQRRAKDGGRLDDE